MMRRRVDSGLFGKRGDEGQVLILVVIAMAIFLIGFVGFAVDMTNMWFHRQMAQGAADAACQAGAMDLLGVSQNALTPRPPGFNPPGSTIDCFSSPSSPPCQYAALNGYPASAANQVMVSFPGTPPPGVTPAPSSYLGSVPAIIRVDVTDPVKLYFAPLITRQGTSDVHAQATCALVTSRAPIPIIILNPTCSEALSSTGSGKITVIGGPSRSIQVNSNNPCSTALSSSGCVTSAPTQCDSPYPSATCAPSNAKIDLTQGGPGFNGSTLGAFGGPTQWGGGFWTGTGATWASPATPIGDPYADLPAPGPPTTRAYTNCAGGACSTPGVASASGGACAFDHLDSYGVHGCPDHTQPCRHYLPGRYDFPIVVSNVTAIFDPGIYYIAPTNYGGACTSGLGNVCPSAACTDLGPITNCRVDFAVSNNGVVRQSTSDIDGSGTEGTMFYLSTGTAPNYGSVFFGSNAGNYGGRTIDDYVPASSPTSVSAQCIGNPNPPTPPMPGTIRGNALLGPCTGIYGDTSVDPVTNVAYPIRGMLMFQDRANNQPTGQASMQGGGGLLLAGTLYFHNCPGSPVCQPYNTDYNGILQLQGNPGSFTRVVGNITVDSLNLSGNGSIDMVLDPNRVRTVLKATLVR
jgi:hypothetical protein